MDARSRAELAAQSHGFVVLADLPAFENTLRFVSPRPAQIDLKPLQGPELRAFVDDWTRQADAPAIVTDEAVERLAEHTGGTPRLIAHLLGAALATRVEHGFVDASAIEDVALLRLGGLGGSPDAEPDVVPDLEPDVAESLRSAMQAEPPTAPTRELGTAAAVEPAAAAALPPNAIPWPSAKPLPRAGQRLHGWRTVAAAASVAACLGLLWLLEGSPDVPPASTSTGGPKLVAANVPAPSSAARTITAAPAEPSPAELAESSMAPAPVMSTPERAATLAPSLAPVSPAPLAQLAEADQAPAAIPPAQIAEAANPAPLQPIVAMLPSALQDAGPALAGGQRAPIAPATAAQVAITGTPAQAAPAAPETASASTVDLAPAADAQIATREAPQTSAVEQPLRGGPGLVLIARRGDTLPHLYASIYRGIEPPPPFAQVAAANPRPFRPGEIVVFPAPPGGWSRP